MKSGKNIALGKKTYFQIMVFERYRKNQRSKKIKEKKK